MRISTNNCSAPTPATTAVVDYSCGTYCFHYNCRWRMIVRLLLLLPPDPALSLSWPAYYHRSDREPELVETTSSSSQRRAPSSRELSSTHFHKTQGCKIWISYRHGETQAGVGGWIGIRVRRHIKHIRLDPWGCSKKM